LIGPLEGAKPLLLLGWMSEAHAAAAAAADDVEVEVTTSEAMIGCSMLPEGVYLDSHPSHVGALKGGDSATVAPLGHVEMLKEDDDELSRKQPQCHSCCPRP